VVAEFAGMVIVYTILAAPVLKRRPSSIAPKPSKRRAAITTNEIHEDESPLIKEAMPCLTEVCATTSVKKAVTSGTFMFMDPVITVGIGPDANAPDAAEIPTAPIMTTAATINTYIITGFFAAGCGGS